MRRLIALAAGAGLLAALTACTSTADGACPVDVQPGRASEAVDANGDFGTAPEVTFPDPLITTSIEKTVLVAGRGESVRNGQPVLLEATILSGADGSVLNRTSYVEGGGSIFAVGAPGLPALGTGLECATVGSRVVIVASGEENAAEGAPASEDSVVYVVDVLDAYKARADGVNQFAEAGMPSVVTAPDGTPGITVPRQDAPSEYEESVLKAGQGEVVEDDAVVLVKYTAVDWDTGEVSESTWLDQSLDVLDLGGEETSEGLRDAVEGKTVGSQVLAVLPPETEGIGTLVYVIDILGTID